MGKQANELLKFLKIGVLESSLEDIQSANGKDRGIGDRVAYATHTVLMPKESGC
jgi:hypothetical protein